MDSTESSDLYPITSSEHDDDKVELHMPTLPLDWAFNDMLISIANAMTPGDLEEAKARFRGDDGLGRRLLDKIKTATELFDSLQKHTFLDRNNLLYLQAMLYKIGRMDLFDIAVDYAHSVGDIIHIKSPPLQPANGYRYVQIHVDGTDFVKFKRSSLESIRMTTAKLMFVPPEYVIIAGIEPSASLIITFMIPERFIKYLEAALKKKEVVKEYTNLGIDSLRMKDITINLCGIEGVEFTETEERMKLKSVYERLRDTQMRLEEQEIECLELKRKIKSKYAGEDSDQFRTRSRGFFPFLYHLFYSLIGKGDKQKMKTT